jgi:hypothetical protein
VRKPRHAGAPAGVTWHGGGGIAAATTPGRTEPDTGQATPRAEPSAPGREADAEFEPLAWLRKHAVVLAAVLLIALQLWWKAGLLEHSFFRLDDFFALERAPTHGLTWSYLMREDAGQLSPLGNAIAWFVIRLSPLDWTLASAVTLTLLALTCLALLRMLRTLFGDNPAILVILVVYLVSPLSFSGMTWWGVTLYQLPLQLAIFCAVTAHVHYLRTGRFRHSVAAACWLVVAMASMIKGVGAPLLLFAMTSAFFSSGAWWRAALAALRRHWRAWLLYFLLAAGYLVVYVIQLSTSNLGPSKPGAFTGVFGFASNMLRDNFIPGALGGPWQWVGNGVEAIANPPAPLAWATCVVAAVVVIVSLWLKPHAWRAWAILVGWLVVVDFLPVLVGRGDLVPGAILGLTTRYVWDALAILAICLGLAFLPMPGEPALRRLGPQVRTYARTALAGVLTAVVIGSAVSLSSYQPDPTAAQGKSFVATARIALAEAPPGSVIVDEPYPESVAGGVFFGSVGRESTLLAPLISGPPSQRPRFIEQPDGVYANLLEFDGWGRLVPPTVAGVGNPTLPRRDRGCWPARGGIVSVPLKSVASSGNMLSIGYLAGKSSRLIVTFGGHSQVVSLLGGGLKTAFMPAHGSGKSVTMRSLSGGIPCIGGATVGFLQPSAGPAIPQLAVSG